MFSRAIPRGESLAEEWEARLAHYREAFPAEAAELLPPARRGRSGPARPTA